MVGGPGCSHHEARGEGSCAHRWWLAGVSSSWVWGSRASVPCQMVLLGGSSIRAGKIARERNWKSALVTSLRGAVARSAHSHVRGTTQGGYQKQGCSGALLLFLPPLFSSQSCKFSLETCWNPGFPSRDQFCLHTS